VGIGPVDDFFGFLNDQFVGFFGLAQRFFR
jgi:hypothetical protein